MKSANANTNASKEHASEFRKQGAALRQAVESLERVAAAADKQARDVADLRHQSERAHELLAKLLTFLCAYDRAHNKENESAVAAGITVDAVGGVVEGLRFALRGVPVLDVGDVDVDDVRDDLEDHVGLEGAFVDKVRSLCSEVERRRRR